MQSRLDELKKEKHLLSEVVSAMCGRFGAPPSPRSESLISRLQGLVDRFQEPEKESFYQGICQVFVIVTSHYEGDRAGSPKQRLL